ncbi:IS1595 family transposase [Spiroplasma endosymbiont of Apeira syringaria]|uniref:IS1595 family transposase n=3 Tax=Spiroplasma endosymbiont of Apeira syringaria TaxID=3066307 RepID=UPI0030D5E11E
MKMNEFNNAFQTEQQCLAYIANLKENKCIRCFSFNLNTSDLKRMRCLKCNQTFSILTGTIFSRSQTSLTSWFYLIFRWINTKHGIPSTDIAKELGVTLKNAWRMTHKIRTRIAKQKTQFIVEGTVQIDEMYLSHMGFKKQGRSLVNKTLIVGIYQKTTNNLTDFSPHVLVEGIMKLNEFKNAFQTEQQCLAYIANLKENKCIRCFSFNLNTSDLKRMRCLKCNQTFSILTGTIFSRSQTSLTSWFYLIFRWINTKHGIPSTDIAKELGVTLKTAWRMTHKIRTRIAKQKPQFIVEGTVQIDEMYLSHMGFKKQGRSLVNKTLIVGIYQKTTNNLIVKVLKNAKSKNLLQFAKNHISSKCLVYTDSWKGYCDFKSVFTKHETVNHQDGYVSKIGVNTNQIESVWKHIRRTFKTHIKVAKHHVHLYAKEAAYKFNKIPSFETVILCLI